MKALAEDFDGVATKLAAGPYAEPALVPAVRPADGPVPDAPRVRRDDAGVAFEAAASPWRWVE